MRWKATSSVTSEPIVIGVVMPAALSSGPSSGRSFRGVLRIALKVESATATKASITSTTPSAASRPAWITLPMASITLLTPTVPKSFGLDTRLASASRKSLAALMKSWPTAATLVSISVISCQGGVHRGRGVGVGPDWLTLSSNQLALALVGCCGVGCGPALSFALNFCGCVKSEIVLLTSRLSILVSAARRSDSFIPWSHARALLSPLSVAAWAF